MGLASAIAAFRRPSPTKDAAEGALKSAASTLANGNNDNKKTPPVNDIGGKVSRLFSLFVLAMRRLSLGECRYGEKWTEEARDVTRERGFFVVDRLFVDDK